MAVQNGGGKTPGKEIYSGRRRTSTRTSGFKSHADSTGGECQHIEVPGCFLKAGEEITFKFTIPKSTEGALLAYGGWFSFAGDLEVSIQGGPSRYCLKQFPSPDWSKFGSIWQTKDGKREHVEVCFKAVSKLSVAFWELSCGVLSHSHLDSISGSADKRSIRLLANMYTFSPEAHFYGKMGSVTPSAQLVSLPQTKSPSLLTLKSCNRCARFLPINVGGDRERNHLSFSNHCVAQHRRPCSHTGFGLLRDTATGKQVKLEYGFQLECRYCKKFEVNAAHNPQRTGAQMKEDGARRRGIELLLEALYKGTPQLLYRQRTGKELADEVFRRFGGKCFKCKRALPTIKRMHLDHTRPLALLWPLDETATALCSSCNSEKRDRPPAQFYTVAELKELSAITGLPMRTLADPSPNVAVLNELGKRLDWFFDQFLSSRDMAKIRDGKLTGELLVKALHKVDSHRPTKSQINLMQKYLKYRTSSTKRT
jgi:hypothetical protein